MSAPQYEIQSPVSLEEQAIRLLGFMLLFILIGPVTVFASIGLYLRMRAWGGLPRSWAVSALWGVLVFAVWLWPTVRSDIAELMHRLVAGNISVDLVTFSRLWLATIPLIPLGAIGIDMWDRLCELLQGSRLSDWITTEEQARDSREAHLSRRAARQVNHAPKSSAGWIRLGPYMKGDHFPPNLGVVRHKQWLALNNTLLDQHLLLIGTTGAGKSEAIKRVVFEVLSSTNRDLFLVDGKGDTDLAVSVQAITHETRRIAPPVFRLGTGGGRALYDGFCGAPQDVYSRLLALSGILDAEGNALYYADVNRDLLQLACYAPGGPPRSFEGLRERLSLDWLRSAWRNNAAETNTLEGIKASDVEALARRLRPLIREFAPLVQPQGFCLDDARTAIFSIRTQSVSDTARRFLNFLVEDLKDFAGKRQKRPAVLIIDEFGAFGNQNILALLSLARSAGLGIILATQDVASLGDETTKRLILANSRTKILMATDFPEEVASLAGTVYQLESSIQHEAGLATGLGSARVQHAFKIDMNEVARLQPGEAFLIRQRYAAKLRISAIPLRAPQEETKRHPPEETRSHPVSMESLDSTPTVREGIDF